jgi:peptidoglycan biosynthesis protein MviN/MurJ (putative lipid II flippase)
MRWLGVEGIALSTTLVTMFLATCLALAACRDGLRLSEPGDTGFIIKTLLSAALMGVSVFAFSIVFENHFEVDREINRLLEVFSGLLLGAGIYAALLRLLGIHVVTSVIRRLARRLSWWS